MAEEFVYKSKQMLELVWLVKKVAKSDVIILIQGETGTGKSMIAELIHKNSHRSDRSFVKLDCATIPENLLESELFGYEKGSFTGADSKGKIGIAETANSGTLFLDEIGAIPFHLQAKLLRMIQEKEIMRIGGTEYIPLDVRIIAATNVDLREAVEKKLFRDDLFYRINVVPITVEPLRNRKDDIKPIGQYYLDFFNKEHGKEKIIDDKAWDAFVKYCWPGNIRELKNIMERLVITSAGKCIEIHEIRNQFSEVELENICFSDVFFTGLKEAVGKYEKQIIIESMENFNSCKELANALKINKSTLTRKMKKYGIENPYFDCESSN